MDRWMDGWWMMDEWMDGGWMDIRMERNCL